MGPVGNRIRWAGVVAGLSAALGVAACGGEGTAPAPSPAPPAAEQGAETVAVPGRTRLRLTAADGTALEYTLVVPEEWEPGGTHPVLLALPPGGQGQAEVDVGLDVYWEAEALARGWVVVSPVAPGQLFFEGAERYIPEVLEDVRRYVQPEGDVFDLAGISNGGLSAFRVALDDPELFRSLLVAPGFPPQAEDFDRLDVLAGIPVALYVGENDADWREEAERTAAELRRLGGEVTLVVSPGEGHILRNVPASELFDFLDASHSLG
jgi:dipeptidyl aminopeptidase/acylaminoacyl peptidase